MREKSSTPLFDAIFALQLKLVDICGNAGLEVAISPRAMKELRLEQLHLTRFSTVPAVLVGGVVMSSQFGDVLVKEKDQ